MIALLLHAISMASRSEDDLVVLKEHHLRTKKKNRPMREKPRPKLKPRTLRGVYENKDTPLHKSKKHA